MDTKRTAARLTDAEGRSLDLDPAAVQLPAPEDVGPRVPSISDLVKSTNACVNGANSLRDALLALGVTASVVPVPGVDINSGRVWFAGLQAHGTWGGKTWSAELGSEVDPAEAAAQIHAYLVADAAG